jgi:putative membrane protein
VADDVNTSNQLALDRTRLASERTLMAWIRTSLSMISFGFTIYKFFEYLKQSTDAKLSNWHPTGTANMGRMLVVLGICLLVPACIQHFLLLRRLHQSTVVRMPVSFAFIAAGLLSILGLGALLNMFFHVGPF